MGGPSQWLLAKVLSACSACLLLTGCAGSGGSGGANGVGAVQESGTAPPGEVPAATRHVARLLIESLERVSSCRYLIDGVSSAPTLGDLPAYVVVLDISYRGPEVQCLQGLETLNRNGAAFGIVFLGTRVTLG